MVPSTRGRFLTLPMFLLALAGPAGCPGEEPAPAASPPPSSVHVSPLAGSWFPSDPGTLRRTIQDLLAQVPEGIDRDADTLVALIVPHAAYTYSGLTAAYGYATLRRRHPQRVILLGPSHTASFHGLSLGEASVYETPLGRLPVDPEARKRLAGCPLVSSHPQAHLQEHSLDIQLPFLQVLFDPPPRIVPLLVGDLDEPDYPLLADCLSPLLDDETVIVVSSDFTHYGPRFSYLPFPQDDFVASKLQILDDGACRPILDLDRSAFLAYRKQNGITVCGFRPITLLLERLPTGTRATSLHYDTSGHATGDYHNSVSYVSIAFTNPSLWSPADNTSETNIPERHPMTPQHHPVSRLQGSDSSLSLTERATLMRLARHTLEQGVRGGRRPDPTSAAYPLTPKLREPRGAFVTLKKHGQLRGCIGYILPLEPLYKAVQENTMNAATRDSRFRPVLPDELDDIQMEISVLSVPEPVSSAREIEIGRHGIVLKQGSRQAVFLPQVAPEQGWDRDETLRQLSRKAGLPPQAWKDPATTYDVFTAEIIEQEAQ
jgi:MEMO1 family protein